jgi:uroporphyrin-III C-methyltransferase / precorrin-2 dehydrogenase / sirohydrochlorin ferrochelatase
MSNANEPPIPLKPGARIGPLANLPVFFKLDGKRVVLVGGGAPALWKAELLSATGALVEIFAPASDDALLALAATPPKGQILLVDRPWVSNDLENAVLAVGSFEEQAEAVAFASAAHAAGVPVNVVDRPALCDFQFGAIVNRSPLVVGISTDGAAPVFGQAIRSMIEGLLPESFGLWAAAARDLRRDGRDIGETSSEKRRFWQRFSDFALQRAGRGPTRTDIDQLAGGGRLVRSSEPITVIDVGENVDMLSLAAVRALRAADDIFFDEDVPAAATDFARREARRHLLERDQVASSAVLGEITKAVSAGAHVVRLRRAFDAQATHGDKELEALRAADVPVVVLSAGFEH